MSDSRRSSRPAARPPGCCLDPAHHLFRESAWALRVRLYRQCCIAPVFCVKRGSLGASARRANARNARLLATVALAGVHTRPPTHTHTEPPTQRRPGPQARARVCNLTALLRWEGREASSPLGLLYCELAAGGSGKGAATGTAITGGTLRTPSAGVPC